MQDLADTAPKRKRSIDDEKSTVHKKKKKKLAKGEIHETSASSAVDEQLTTAEPKDRTSVSVMLLI